MDDLDKEMLGVSLAMGVLLPLAMVVLSWLAKQPWLIKLGL